MNQLLRNLVALVVIGLICISNLSAQVVVAMQYRNVPDENIGEFVYRETTYWKEIARKAINEDKMMSWALYQKVGGWEMPGGSNFVFVNVFENPEDLDHISEIWDPSGMFPEIPMSSIETNSLSTVNHQIFVQGVARVGDGAPQFVRVNYVKASDLGRYLELEQSTWQPFITQQMESQKTSQLTWRLAALLMPAGTDLPFNAFTSDGYNNMSEAIAPETTFPEGTEFPDLTELNEVHDKVYIQVYGLVDHVN